MTDRPHTPLLDQVHGPADLKRLGDAQLVQLAHEPGALAEAMNVFKRHRLNMTWVESFPMPARPSEYLFFFEFEGHQQELRVRKALQALEKKTQKMDLLGSYGKWSPSWGGTAP